ncbi:MAG: NUDIX hydrolase [Hydrogenophilus sp.]|nr:NUDIX hydrolase [Hydrogenophilus sp.]
MPLAQQVAWEGHLLRVRADRVHLPDGSEGRREYIAHPGAAMVVALTDTDEVVMVRQFRYPVGAVVEELPAGKVDEGESPLACAQRELEEETGYRAQRWRSLGWFWPNVGYSSEVIHIFLAEGLTAGTPRREAGEFLEVFWVPLSQLMARVAEGSIGDGKTTVAVVRAAYAVGKIAFLEGEG